MQQLKLAQIMLATTKTTVIYSQKNDAYSIKNVGSLKARVKTIVCEENIFG